MKSTKDVFRERLNAEGLHDAIRWLNARVPYRYTAIFAFAGDMLQNVCLVDKENEDITRCPDSPIGNSYCTYIRQSGEQFSVEASLSDPRVEDHPKQATYQCYYGVPLYKDGKLLGTVCHFDTVPIPVTEEIASVLDDVAPLITEATFESTTRASLPSQSRGSQG